MKVLSAFANTYMYYPNFESHKVVRFFLYVVSVCYCKMFGYRKLLQKIDKIRTKIDYDRTEYVYTITHGSRGMVFPKSYFEEIEWKKFENILLPVPKAYDAILKKHYGVYMKSPSEEKRDVHHQISLHILLIILCRNQCNISSHCRGIFSGLYSLLAIVEFYYSGYCDNQEKDNCWNVWTVKKEKIISRFFRSGKG